MPPFFGLATPQDMLQKARRELEKFEMAPSIDHVFNFCVTIYHVRDYAKAKGLWAALAAMDADPDFELCRLACNQGKHLQLTGGTLSSAVNRNYDSHADIAYEGVERYAVLADGIRIDVSKLGRSVIALLERVLEVAPT